MGPVRGAGAVGGANDTVGLDGRYTDPLWRVRVELTDLERALLRTWPVRRLGYIAHAGAAALTTTQSYSRLEHSLGVLALTAHFTPEDQPARAAALLHDLGHLPFSHTFEHVAGLDHHVLGETHLTGLDPLLTAHGLTAEQVSRHEQVQHRRRRSRNLLGLDHLDSFLRSGQAHGRTTEAPHQVLGRLRLVEGAIDTDAGTAAQLSDLVAGEARSHLSVANVLPHAVLRELAEILLAGAGSSRRQQIAAMTDDEFWALVLTDPRTSHTAELLRRDPLSWSLQPRPDEHDPSALVFEIRRLYLALPTTDGRPAEPGPTLRSLPAVPIRFQFQRPDVLDAADLARPG